MGTLQQGILFQYQAREFGDHAPLHDMEAAINKIAQMRLIAVDYVVPVDDDSTAKIGVVVHQMPLQELSISAMLSHWKERPSPIYSM